MSFTSHERRSTSHSASSSSSSRTPRKDQYSDDALLARSDVQELITQRYISRSQVGRLRENPDLLDRLIATRLPLHEAQIITLSDPESCLTAALKAFNNSDVRQLLKLSRISQEYVFENFADPNFYLNIRGKMSKSAIHDPSFSIDNDDDDDDDDDNNHYDDDNDVDDKGKRSGKAPVRRRLYTESSSNTPYPYESDHKNPRVLTLIADGFLTHNQAPLLRENQELLKILLSTTNGEEQVTLPKELEAQVNLLSNPDEYFDAMLKAFEDAEVVSLLRRGIITSDYVLQHMSDFTFYSTIARFTADNTATPTIGVFGGGISDTFPASTSAPSEQPRGNVGLSFATAPRRGAGDNGNFGVYGTFAANKKSSGPNSRVTSYNFEQEGGPRGNLAATTTFATTRNLSRNPSVSYENFAISTDDLTRTSYFAATATDSPRSTSSPRLTTSTINASRPPSSTINRHQQDHATTAVNHFYDYAKFSGAEKRKAWRLAITEWLLYTNDRKNTQYVAEKAPGDSCINAHYFQFIQNSSAATTSALHAYAALLALLNYFLANQAKPLLKQSFPWDQDKRSDDFIELLVTLDTPQTLEQLQHYLAKSGVDKGFVAKPIPIPVLGQGLSYWRPPTQEYQDLRLDLAECVKNGSTTSQDLTTAARWLLIAMRSFANSNNKSLESSLLERHKTRVDMVSPSYTF